MKIQCDVCEKAPAAVICCADEAALCETCDVQVHAANKLASKHPRLYLQSLSQNLPRCDICQEKAAFIFCVEDRALFCKDCDEPIHSANNLAKNHRRYLAAGIRVALSSGCDMGSSKSQFMPRPPNSISNSKPTPFKIPTQHASDSSSPSWAVDDLLQFSDSEFFDKKDQIEFNEFNWLTDINLYEEQASQEASSAAAEVPELSSSFQSHNTVSYRPTKIFTAHKKARIEIPDKEDEHFLVPDLG